MGYALSAQCFIVRESNQLNKNKQKILELHMKSILFLPQSNSLVHRPYFNSLLSVFTIAYFLK
jgi:hypothetical protein